MAIVVPAGWQRRIADAGSGVVRVGKANPKDIGFAVAKLG